MGASIAVVYDDHLYFSKSFSAVLERLMLFKSVRVGVSDEQAYPPSLIKHVDGSAYSLLDYRLSKKALLLLLDLSEQGHVSAIHHHGLPPQNDDESSGKLHYRIIDLCEKQRIDLTRN